MTKEKILSQIEGLEWHLSVLRGYKLTKNSCSPKSIKRWIEEDEKELESLKKLLA